MFPHPKPPRLGGGAVVASLSQIQGAVTDADIYAAIDSVKPVGTVVWTRISN